MMRHLLFIAMIAVFGSTAYGQFSTVGIIGTATPEGWDASTPMVQDDDDPNVWTLEVTLVDGELKFRADDDWEFNWGDTGFPFGEGEQDGPNIQVIGGDYFITFNSETGDYFFDYDGTVGIIGSATPFGWDRDVFMFPDESMTVYTLNVPLEAGEIKFRQDADWGTNWGGEDFPEGEAIFDGPNIPVDQGGMYAITFDVEAGFYSFELIVGFDSISIIGSATPGGWDEDTHLQRDANNTDLWRGVVDLVEGELKFRAENDWAVNWGGDTFPTGIAVPNGDDIVVDTAGEYIVTFNTSTLEYNFLLVEEFDVVSIIGDATPGGWVEDTDMEQDPEDKTQWSLRAVLTDGEMKFRANNDWAINWGAGAFPEGTAVQDGANIPVVAGEYFIYFNSTTGDYFFDLIEEYGAVSIVGQSGPFGEWPSPDDGGAVDWFMDKDPDDGNIWTTTGVQLFDFDPDEDDGIKFRADTAWTVNWGAVDFPEGVATQDGPNIEPVAGVYDVVFNAVTGEYVFSPSTSVRENFINPDQIKVFPNPTADLVTIQLEGIDVGAEVSVTVFDISGKQVATYNFSSSNELNFDVSGLQTGNYILHITDGQFFSGKRLSVMR